MRSTVLAAAAALLGACSASAPPTTSGPPGANNTAALDAAAACRMDQALIIARGAENTPRPPERLFSLLTQAALLTEMGQPGQAAKIIDEVTADPALNPRTEQNPQGRSREEIAVAVQSLSDTIIQRRTQLTGSPTC